MDQFHTDRMSQRTTTAADRSAQTALGGPAIEEEEADRRPHAARAADG
jgi:hypothetical protein